MFGAGETQAATQTVASGVEIQSSCYGGVVPVIYGRARLTGNLLWYGDFQAIPVQSSAGGGKGGDDNHGSTSYDYKASFIFALGEGTLADVQNVWASKTKTALADSHLSFASGALTQAPWGYLTTKFSAQALAYAGTGYVYAMAYDLGSSAQMPNLSYEVTGLFSGAISGLPDADPKDVVTSILTDTRFGVGFPTGRLGDLSVFSGYCRAAGLVVSPVYDTQSDAASVLNDLVQSCNAEFVWSGTTLTIVPYGDADLAANGATYTAPAAPLFSLTDDDFLDQDGQDPVQCSRARPSDQMNAIRLEWLNRANDYNAEIAEAKNQAAIEAYGLRGDQPAQAHQFCDLNAATLSATLKLQRQSVRNVYSFTLGWRYCLLDPMDIVEITDAGLGLDQQWVRVLSLEEDDNGNIKITAEEYLGGTGHAPLYSYESGSPYIADYNAPPGAMNAPLIFEPPPVMLAARSISAPQIMIGASGAAGWGGCDVWLSLDNATYKRMGRIAAPARQGFLLNTLASGADPDTMHTLSVDLSESGGGLLSGTSSDADAFRTLCYVDGELIAYETASLTGANQYGLTYLRRGVYGSTVTAHAAGTAFCRLDDSAASFNLPVTPVDYAGQTLYLKFLSFNIYGGGQQQLADVRAVLYNPNGAGTFVYPPSGVTFTVGAEQQKDGTWVSFGILAWTASPDPLFDQYEVQYRLHAGPGPWISWRGGPDTTSFRISPLPADTAYDVQVRAVRTSGPFYSAWAQSLDITTAGKTTAPPAPTSISASGGYRQIELKWVASGENDIAWYEIWESADTVLAHASRIGLVTATHYLRPGLNLGDTRSYWVRAQDTSGNFSAYLGPATATTLGVDAADITGQIVNAQIAANAVAASNLISGQQIVQVVSSISLADHTVSKFAYDTSASQLYTWSGSAWLAPTAAVLAGSLTAAAFASGITPVQIVSVLPGGGTEGQVVILTTDGKLYRYHAGAWTKAADGADIIANSITGGAIAAGAITASILDVDTANMVSDPTFADVVANGWNGGAYWEQVFTTSGAGAAIWTIKDASSLSAQAMQVSACANVEAVAITTGTGTRILSGLIQIDASQAYRLQALFMASGAGTSASAQTIRLAAMFYDGSGALLATINGTAYAPAACTTTLPVVLSFGGPGEAAPPAGAVYVRFSAQVLTNGDITNAVNWFVALPAIRLGIAGTMITNGAVGTNQIAANSIQASHIQAGTITGAQIAAAGITGTNIAGTTITGANIAGTTITAANIAAGTLTGDKFTGNFFQGCDFTAGTGTGSGFLEMDGRSTTISGHVYGPVYRAVDDSGQNRVAIGRQGDAFGLWVWDATGNLIFEESALGTSVVATGNVKAGNMTAVGSASVANGPFGNGAWQVAASSTITLYDGAVVVVLANVLLGYSSGPKIWGLKLNVDGTDMALTQPGVANTQTGLAISWSGTLSGSSGGSSHTVTLYWNADSTVQIDGGTLSILGPQR